LPPVYKILIAALVVIEAVVGKSPSLSGDRKRDAKSDQKEKAGVHH
jgi:hypothetical protein